MSDTSIAGWRDILIPQYALSLALVCLSVWLHAADLMLVATMLPTIVSEIGGARMISWALALYEIGSIVAGACAGLMAMRHGVRSPMIVAASIYAIGCMLSALAPEMWILLAGRLLQGLGGGGLVALSFVAISILFPKHLTARVMAAVSALWGTAAFAGPMIGGLFVEFATWRGGFWFFAAQAAVLVLWILVIVRPDKQKARDSANDRIPGIRLSLLSVGVVLIAYSGIEVSLGRTTGLVAAGILALVIFLWLDARQGDNRLLPRNPISLGNPISAALAMVFCLCIATIAITAYGPLLMTKLHNAPALVAGYVIACSSVGWSVAAIVVSGLPEKYDNRMILGGMVVLTVSVMGFAYSVPNGPVWLIAVFAALEGVGFGMSWTFILRSLTALSKGIDVERVAGAMPTVQRLGYAIGAAYVGIAANAAGLAEATTPDQVSDAGRVLFLACIPFAVIGLIAAVRFTWSRKPLSSTKHG